MILLVNLFGNRKQENSDAHKRIRIGDQTIFLNSRGRIPVILQQKWRKKSEIINLVFMNHDALELSLKSGEIYIFRRSAGEIQKLICRDENGYKIESIRINKNRRSLLITVRNGQLATKTDNFIYEVKLHNKEEEKI